MTNIPINANRSKLIKKELSLSSGSDLVSVINKTPRQAADKKFYVIDVATTQMNLLHSSHVSA